MCGRLERAAHRHPGGGLQRRIYARERLDRVPKSFRPRISAVYVCDDASGDSTYLVGLGLKQVVDDMPLRITRHPENLGYGGNQKAGYRMAIDEGLDIIVMLHGDGQYAPECLPEISPRSSGARPTPSSGRE